MKESSEKNPIVMGNGWPLESQYRIPSLYEFKPGFKYEVWSDGDDSGESVEDFFGWYKYDFMQNGCWRDKEDIKTALKNNWIRAKR